MALLTLNGTAMPEPSSFTVAVQDLDSDSTKRNESGILQRDRIRQGVRKLTCKWNALGQSDAAAVMQAVRPASVTAEYFDMEDGADKTLTAYVGDRSCERVVSQIGPRWTISFDLIEF